MGKDRGEGRTKERCRARIILFFLSFFFFFFFAASRRCIPAYIRLTSVFHPAETTIVIIPRRDFRNFIFSLFLARPPFRKFLFSPLPLGGREFSRSRPPRNAHNYGHVTRLISWLNSLLGPDRPISSFDKEGSTIANRRTRFEHTLFFFTLFWSILARPSGIRGSFKGKSISLCWYFVYLKV